MHWRIIPHPDKFERLTADRGADGHYYNGKSSGSISNKTIHIQCEYDADELTQKVGTNRDSGR